MYIDEMGDMTEFLKKLGDSEFDLVEEMGSLEDSPEEIGSDSLYNPLGEDTEFGRDDFSAIGKPAYESNDPEAQALRNIEREERRARVLAADNPSDEAYNRVMKEMDWENLAEVEGIPLEDVQRMIARYTRPAPHASTKPLQPEGPYVNAGPAGKTAGIYKGIIKKKDVPEVRKGRMAQAAARMAGLRAAGLEPAVDQIESERPDRDKVETANKIHNLEQLVVEKAKSKKASPYIRRMAQNIQKRWDANEKLARAAARDLAKTATGAPSVEITGPEGESLQELIGKYVSEGILDPEEIDKIVTSRPEKFDIRKQRERKPGSTPLASIPHFTDYITPLRGLAPDEEGGEFATAGMVKPRITPIRVRMGDIPQDRRQEILIAMENGATPEQVAEMLQPRPQYKAVAETVKPMISGFSGPAPDEAALAADARAKEQAESLFTPEEMIAGYADKRNQYDSRDGSSYWTGANVFPGSTGAGEASFDPFKYAAPAASGYDLMYRAFRDGGYGDTIVEMARELYPKADDIQLRDVYIPHMLKQISIMPMNEKERQWYSTLPIGDIPEGASDREYIRYVIKTTADSFKRTAARESGDPNYVNQRAIDLAASKAQYARETTPEERAADAKEAREWTLPGSGGKELPYTPPATDYVPPYTLTKEAWSKIGPAAREYIIATSGTTGIEDQATRAKLLREAYAEWASSWQKDPSIPPPSQEAVPLTTDDAEAYGARGEKLAARTTEEHRAQSSPNYAAGPKMGLGTYRGGQLVGGPASEGRPQNAPETPYDYIKGLNYIVQKPKMLTFDAAKYGHPEWGKYTGRKFVYDKDGRIAFIPLNYSQVPLPVELYKAPVANAAGTSTLYYRAPDPSTGIMRKYFVNIPGARPKIEKLGDQFQILTADGTYEPLPAQEREPKPYTIHKRGDQYYGMVEYPDNPGQYGWVPISAGSVETAVDDPENIRQSNNLRQTFQKAVAFIKRNNVPGEQWGDVFDQVGIDTNANFAGNRFPDPRNLQWSDAELRRRGENAVHQLFAGDPDDALSRIGYNSYKPRNEQIDRRAQMLEEYVQENAEDDLAELEEKRPEWNYVNPRLLAASIQNDNGLTEWERTMREFYKKLRVEGMSEAEVDENEQARMLRLAASVAASGGMNIETMNANALERAKTTLEMIARDPEMMQQYHDAAQTYIDTVAKPMAQHELSGLIAAAQRFKMAGKVRDEGLALTKAREVQDKLSAYANSMKLENVLARVNDLLAGKARVTNAPYYIDHFGKLPPGVSGLTPDGKIQTPEQVERDLQNLKSGPAGMAATQFANMSWTAITELLDTLIALPEDQFTRRDELYLSLLNDEIERRMGGFEQRPIGRGGAKGTPTNTPEGTLPPRKGIGRRSK